MIRTDVRARGYRRAHRGRWTNRNRGYYLGQLVTEPAQAPPRQQRQHSGERALGHRPHEPHSHEGNPLHAERRAQRHENLPHVENGDDRSPGQGEDGDETAGARSEHRGEKPHARTVGGGQGAEGHPAHGAGRPEHGSGGQEAAPTTRTSLPFLGNPFAGAGPERCSDEPRRRQDARGDEERIAHDSAAIDYGVAQKPLEANEQVRPRNEGGEPDKQPRLRTIERHNEKGLACRRGDIRRPGHTSSAFPLPLFHVRNLIAALRLSHDSRLPRPFHPLAPLAIIRRAPVRG